MNQPQQRNHKYTMEDVAAEAGVSRTSVSRVMLGQNKVSEATRIRVRAAADRMGYIPNVMASELAAGATNTIGLLLRDASNPAYGMLFTELETAAHKAGLTLVSMTIGDNNRDQQQIASLNHLVGMRVAGLIVATGGVSSEQLKPFLQRIPIVRAGRPETTDYIHAVSYDEEHAGRELAKHVISLEHRDVAVLITAETKSYPEFIRSTTMVSVLREHGVRVTTVPVSDLDGGIKRAGALAIEGTVSAIMCPSDIRQLSLLSHLKTIGLSAPEDVSVSGCDGIMPGIDLMGLTTFQLPVAELARSTVALMARLIQVEPPNITVQKRLPGILVAGRSVGKPSSSRDTR